MTPTVRMTMTALLGLVGLLKLVSGLPMQMSINQRGTECLYEKLTEGEHVTMSLFILSGAELRATAILDGPVAPPHVDTGAELQDAINNFEQGARYGQHMAVEDEVDFEHMKPPDSGEDSFDDEDDDEEEPTNEEERLKWQRRKAQKARQRAKEYRMKKAQMMLETKKKIQREGEPYEATLQAKHAGWYRACVRGTWYQIVVELEMRKESELGGVDEETGHVYTYQRRGIMEEDKLLEEDTASEEGIKDEDFDSVREKLRKLRRLLSEIQTKQTAERHRLVVHAATNEHSHSRMVLSSLFETVLYMVVTGYQVYTIRKWFSGAPVLGR